MSVYASIDLGSNTVRLLVAKKEKDKLETLLSSHRITRLGKGLNAGGNLSAEAIRDTIGAIKEFKKEAAPYKPEQIWIVATSAVRPATNQAAFIKDVFEETGLKIEVIPWHEEAKMASLGVNYALGIKGEILLFDIGGGSTEFILCEGGEIKESVGTELGVVTLAETYIKNNPPQEYEILTLAAEVDKNIKDVKSKITLSQGCRLVGTAGTITTVAAIDMDMFPYDPLRINGHRIGRDRIEEIKNTLSGLTLKEIENMPQIEKGREDLILPGIIIICRVMDIFGFKEMMISDYGLREGIILANI